MTCFYSDTFVLPLPEAHRFPMAKYQRLRERLLQEATVEPADLIVPEPAGWDDLRRTHDAIYVDAVANGTLTAEMQRRIGFPWSPAMVERARRSVGATICAAGDALDGGWVSANLAGGTHHGFRDRGEGYCVFNDIAVTAEKLLAEASVDRVLVIDCDVHQGNGTAAIFRDEPRVFTLSLHGASNFPFRKEVSDLDLAFPDGTGDHAYLQALTATVPRLVDEVAPDIVFYLAGADPYEGDRLGKLALTIEGLRQRDAFVFDQCAAAGVPVAVSMGGGYAPDVEAIVTIHANTIREASRSAQRCLSSKKERRRRPSR
jgi:acetoin utilization deacetylase AcuC-like enzyme